MKKSFKKINDNFYIVNFPNKTDEIYFDIYIKTGYSDESEKEFGTGHLLEHYLVESVLNSKKIEFSNGSIGDDFTNYYLKSKQNRFLKEIGYFLDFILNPKIEDKNLLEKEKEVIKNEINSKKSIKIDALNFFLQTNFGKNFPNSRDKGCQVSNIKKIKLDDLKKYHANIFNNENIFFILSGYNLNKETQNKTLKLIKNFTLAKSKKIKKQEFSLLKVGTLKNPKYHWNDELMINFCFDIPAKMRNDQKVLKALVFLRDYIEDQRFDFPRKMRDSGIYSVSFDRLISKKAGMIAVSVEGDRDKIIFFKNSFENFLETLKNDGISKSVLMKLKKMEKERLQKSFSDNMKRLSWVVNDILNYNKVFVLSEDIKEINKIDPEYMKKISNDIFKTDKMNIVIFGKKAKEVRF